MARLPLSGIALLVPTFLSMVASAGNTHEAAHTGVRVGVLALGCAVASALPEVSSGSVTSRQGASDHPLTFVFRPSFQSACPGKGPAQPQAAKSSSRRRDGDIHTSRRDASAASLHAGATSGTPGQHTDERHARRAPKPEEVPTGKSWLLLRHGQTNFNKEGRIQGSTDFSRLSEEGARQAKDVGTFLAGLTIDAVYVSPLSRARETLEIAEASGRRLPPAAVVTTCNLYSQISNH